MFTFDKTIKSIKMSEYLKLAEDIKYRGWSEKQIADMLGQLYSKGYSQGWKSAWAISRRVLDKYKIKYNELFDWTKKEIQDFVHFTRQPDYKQKFNDTLNVMDNMMADKGLYVSKISDTFNLAEITGYQLIFSDGTKIGEVSSMGNYEESGSIIMMINGKDKVISFKESNILTVDYNFNIITLEDNLVLRNILNENK
jgi:ribosomal 30S subunit maturation factor RimM